MRFRKVGIYRGLRFDKSEPRPGMERQSRARKQAVFSLYEYEISLGLRREKYRFLAVVALTDRTSDPYFKMKHTLDAKNLLCPMPLIRVQNTVRDLEVGDTLEVSCTDPGTLFDIPAWCKMFGHEVVETHETDQLVTLLIRIGVGG